MKRLTHVAFAHPIPIPGTHLRQSDFSADDGWSIEDDDGRIVLSKGERAFYTYVSASCVEAPAPALATDWPGSEGVAPSHPVAASPKERDTAAHVATGAPLPKKGRR